MRYVRRMRTRRGIQVGDIAITAVRGYFNLRVGASVNWRCRDLWDIEQIANVCSRGDELSAALTPETRARLEALLTASTSRHPDGVFGGKRTRRASKNYLRLCRVELRSRVPSDFQSYVDDLRSRGLTEG